MGKTLNDCILELYSDCIRLERKLSGSNSGKTNKFNNLIKKVKKIKRNKKTTQVF